MNQCDYKSYQYKNKTYRINQLQQEVYTRIKSLPRKHLHYIVAQQANDRPNINLKQMKSSIKRAVRRYVSELNYPYNPKLDKLLVQYVCVFETSKEFHLGQYNQETLDDDAEVGLHFHLFVTSPNDYPWVDFNTLSHYVLHELSGFSKKSTCISKFDCRKLDELKKEFILYHTKQFYQRPSKSMIMTNV